MTTLFELPLTKEDNLLKKFEEIHDFIYANDGLSPQQTLEEFVKILFIKIYDENQKNSQFSISANEWNELNKGNTIYIVEKISKLFDETKRSYHDIFDSDDRIRISPIALGYSINKLQGISLIKSSQDAKGLAFQKFLTHHEKDGRGQFFTPEPVIDFCVAMMQPKKNEKIIDPACGSGGFLMSALKFIKENEEKIDIKNVISNNLYGTDINKSIARIAKMKLLLESNDKTNIICANSLEDIDNFKMSISNTKGFDLILANPPFGAKITSPSILSKFDLGYKWKFNDGIFKMSKYLYLNQNAEILFIERCLQLLKEGGRMAIVLPNGNFENPSMEYLRYYIKSKSKILAIVNLPYETFVPFGTGVKTSLLFLEKNTSNKINKYSIFFGRVTKLGYQGNKNGTPIYLKDKYGQIIKDKSGKQILDENFSELINIYKEFLKGRNIESENTFTINYEELNGRFDYDFYSPENRSLFKKLDLSKNVRLGDICEIIKIKSKKLKDQNSTVEYVELSDINSHSYEIINSTTCKVYELPSRASYEILDGDIITAVAGNSIGTRKHATALVSNDFEGSICTNGFRVLRNFKIDKYYLLFYLKTDSFLKQIYMYRTGAAIPNISDIDLSNTLISLPDEKTINDISSKMKKAFDLRNQSKEVIDSIKF